MPDIQLDGATARAALDVYYATVAQGALADSATQPGDLGTAAAQDVGAFATAAQGATADTALQNAAAFATAAQGTTADSALQTVAVPSDLTTTGVPSAATFLRGDGVWAVVSGGGGGDLLAANNLADVADTATSLANLGGATAAQGALADTALQNAAAFATSAQGALADTATQPGDLGTAAAQNVEAFATAAQGTTADTALQTVAVPADITATGTASATTFLRGDGAWAAAGLAGVDGDVIAYQPLLYRNDGRSTELTYTVDDLTQVLEKDGATTVKQTDLTYTAGKLTSVVELADSITVTTTLTYTGDKLTSTGRVVS